MSNLSENEGTADNSNESDYEEEEMYVYADFQSKIPAETLNDPNVNFKIIGLNTHEPLVQINSKIFKGSYEYTCGTNVFFEEDPDATVYNPNFETEPSTYYKYLAKSEKTLFMNRIFIENIDAKSEKTTRTSSASSLSKTVPLITKSYQEALNQFLKPGTKPPRKCEPEDEDFFQKYGTPK